MEKKELLEKFCALYNEAINSGDKEDIEVSLGMFKKAFGILVDTNVREAKELVDNAPKTLKEGVSKAEAEEIKAKLEAEGAEVSMK